jgi:acyl-CoA reductase-like NAD-dependent aldehyde dehydrogenase
MSEQIAMKGQHLIDGQWRDGGATAETRSPSDLDEVVGTYAQGGKAEAQEAIHAARRALPGWAALNIQVRADILRKVGDSIIARSAEIGTLLAREEGKTRREAIGEAQRAAQVFHYYAGEVVRHPGQFLNSLRDGHSIFVSYEPVGVVSLITPWNFPIAVPAWKVAAALAYGNTCVLKPSEFAPGCAVLLGRILVDAGVPRGVFNLVLGDGRLLGETLVTHADGVSFTGSTPTGRLILKLAAPTMTKVQLELGGKNPLVILDDAELDNAVTVALQATWGQTGQRCTGSERLIVTRGIHDEFVERLRKQVAALRVGHALDENTEIGPVATAPQLAKNLAFIERARQDGAELAAGGKTVEARSPGHYLAPTLFVGTTNSMHLNREEIFGPVAGVIKVDDIDEAIAVARDCELALSSGICTTSIRSAERFRRASTAGLVMINAPTAGIEYHVPFGGRAPSGYGGREQGTAGAEFFTEMKTTYLNHGVT